MTNKISHSIPTTAKNSSKNYNQGKSKDSKNNNSSSCSSSSNNNGGSCTNIQGRVETVQPRVLLRLARILRDQKSWGDYWHLDYNWKASNKNWYEKL